LSAALLVGLGVRPAAASPWQYVVPPEGAPFAHPPLTDVLLSETKPADLQERAAYRGDRQQYAQVRFGTPGSLRVTVVVDRVSAEEMDLYVDRDRDLTIQAAEQVEHDGSAWRTTLDALVVRQGRAEDLPRTMVFQLSRTGGSLRLATCGYLEGAVSLSRRPCTVRRTDGNANGLFADAGDRLWIDLNRDGHWDAIGEQFLLAPILVLGGTRHAVRSNQTGDQLVLEEIQGTGNLELGLPPGIVPQVTQVAMTLIGRDGCVATLAGNGARISVPMGEYRAGAVAISVKDPAEGSAWNYVFADDNQRGDYVWHRVESEGSVSLDPISGLGLEADLDGKAGMCSPGEELTVQPWLHTGDGLVIASMLRAGTGQESRVKLEGSLALVAPGGAVLDQASIRFG
jgi:hypothetical protein